MENINEIWKPIKGYEGLYEVSNIGRVRSLNYWCKIGNVQIKKLSKDNHGYLHVRLCKSGKQTIALVHRLVAEAFIPNDDPEHKTQVNHKDECKTTNFVWVNEDGTINPEKSNLEWCDRVYNINYGTGIKRSVQNRQKPIKQMTLDGDIIKIWPSTTEASKNGFNKDNIYKCLRGKRITHRGFKWQY